jgi:hypothetical protein
MAIERQGFSAWILSDPSEFAYEGSARLRKVSSLQAISM